MHTPVRRGGDTPAHRGSVRTAALTAGVGSKRRQNYPISAQRFPRRRALSRAGSVATLPAARTGRHPRVIQGVPRRECIPERLVVRATVGTGFPLAHSRSGPYATSDAFAEITCSPTGSIVASVVSVLNESELDCNWRSSAAPRLFPSAPTRPRPQWSDGRSTSGRECLVADAKIRVGGVIDLVSPA